MTQFFEMPALLLLAIVLPLLVSVLLASAHHRRMARLAKLGNNDVVKRLLPPGAFDPPGRRVLYLSGAALFAAVAIAGPRWGSQDTRVTGSGVDIVLALDASLSMTANDERPTRLERMKQEVRRLRASSTGDRIGVIAFAGRSYILTPLTTDQGALDLFLDNLDPSIVGQAGSAVSRAINQGTDLLLATESSSDRALVIMSDWESFDTQSEVLSAAERARDAGISVVAVGFGTEAGSRIPMAAGSRTQFKLDEVGRIVVTKYDGSLLRSVVSAAGGIAVEASASDKAARVRRALSTLRAQQRTLNFGSDRKQRFQLFLIPALILVLADTLRSERLSLRRLASAVARRRRKLAAASVAGLFALPLQGNPVLQDKAHKLAAERRYAEAAEEYRRRIRAGDSSDETLYNLGTALLLADSLAGAAGVLQALSTSGDPELRYRAIFNNGLAHLTAGLHSNGRQRDDALKAAISSYRDALLMRPDDLDAKWNYELALQQRQSGGGSGGQQQQSQSAQDNQQDESQQREERSPLGREQAEQILDNAARDERDVQARAQERNRPSRPPGGKDW